MENDGPDAILDQFQSLFGDLFGVTSERDLRELLVIDLAEAAQGGERTIELSRATACGACHGRGGAPGATYEPCVECAGRGGGTRAVGHFTHTSACKACGGARGRWSASCPSCDGRRATHATKRVRVTIPPGVVQGQMLRLAGQGHDLGEGAGDALLMIEIARHPTLRREGDDLRVRVRIDGELAELARHGGETRVPWLTGTVRVRVPAGATHGSEARVRGWGCVRLGAKYEPPPTDDSPYRSASSTTRGDLIVTFVTHDDEEAEDAAAQGEVFGADATASGLAGMFEELSRAREDPVDRALREHDAPSSRATAVGVALFALALGLALVLLAR